MEQPRFRRDDLASVVFYFTPDVPTTIARDEGEVRIEGLGTIRWQVLQQLDDLSALDQANPREGESVMNAHGLGA